MPFDENGKYIPIPAALCPGCGEEVKITLWVDREPMGDTYPDSEIWVDVACGQIRCDNCGHFHPIEKNASLHNFWIEVEKNPTSGESDV